jgi:cobyrinic acid a,c-diamide synthase
MAKRMAKKMEGKGAIRSCQRARGFMIAGPASGVGKTTVTLSIMAALRKRGLAVQPFKCGPDFIDGGHHTRVCGRASRNLDGWMLSAEANRDIFARAALGADICIAEGMMGLFDGAGGKSDQGSSAEIAKWLELPVILVVDAASMARSAAALVHGFESFDPAVKVAGVVFNNVGGAAHYQMLKEAVESGTRARALGFLPREQRIHIPERYLGLFTAAEVSVSELSLLAEMAEASIDLDRLLECAAWISAGALAESCEPASLGGQSIRVGVARDKAFCFYYEDNFEALRKAGARIIEFSPLDDSSLPGAPEGPQRLDALYFGGGYPELHAQRLAENHKMLGAIKEAAAAGLPIYAECGGLMYLAREIVTREGASFPMAAVLPMRVQMTDRLVNFGYSEVSLASDCLLGPAGAKARGHSFHCSQAIESGEMQHVYRTRNSMTRREEPEGFAMSNVLASYIHLHFLSNPEIAGAFVKNVARARQRASIPAGISASGIES